MSNAHDESKQFSTEDFEDLLQHIRDRLGDVSYGGDDPRMCSLINQLMQKHKRSGNDFNPLAILLGGEETILHTYTHFVFEAGRQYERDLLGPSESHFSDEDYKKLFTKLGDSPDEPQSIP